MIREMKSFIPNYDKHIRFLKQHQHIYPFREECNVLTKLLGPGSPYGNIQVTQVHPKFAGFVAFLFVYHNTLCDTTLDIPPETWRFLGRLVILSETHFKLIYSQQHLARTKFFPHVKRLAAKMGISPDVLYKEQMGSGVVLFSDIQSWLADPIKSGLSSIAKRHLAQFHGTSPAIDVTKKQLSMGDYVFCTGKNAHTRQGRHDCTHGKGNTVCRDCGMVLSQVFEHEPTFVEGKLIRHMTEEKPRLGRLVAYDGVRKPNKKHVVFIKNHEPETTLDKHRASFHVEVERITTSPELRCLFKTLWESCLIEHRPGPAFNVKLMMVAYMVWRSTRPKSEHFLDTHIVTKKIKYVVLDDARSTSPIHFPKWYAPERPPRNSMLTMESSIFASRDVGAVHRALLGSLPKCKVSPSHTLANKRIRLQTFRQFAKEQMATFETHMKDNPAKYGKRKLASQEEADAQEDELSQDCQKFLQRIRCKFVQRFTKIKNYPSGQDVAANVRKYVDLNFHGVGYRAYVHNTESTRFSIVPKTFSGTFDIAVRVRMVYANAPRRPSPIAVLYNGWQCPPFVSEPVDEGNGDAEIWTKFFVKNYKSKHGVFTIKVGQGVYNTTPEDLVVCRQNRFPLYERYFGRTSVLEKRNNRRRLIVQVCPLPLKIIEYPHQVNAYLNTPLYSPAKALRENTACTSTSSDTNNTKTNMIVMPQKKRRKRTKRPPKIIKLRSK